MEPPPRSLALDAHYCIMVRVPWPAEYKYASAIGCACWRAPLGIDSLPTTTCYRRPNTEPMASAFPRSRRGHGCPSNKQRDQTTRTGALTEIPPYKCLGRSDRDGVRLRPDRGGRDRHLRGHTRQARAALQCRRDAHVSERHGPAHGQGDDLHGQPIDAARAERRGMINYVVPLPEL